MMAEVWADDIKGHQCHTPVRLNNYCHLTATTVIPVSTAVSQNVPNNNHRSARLQLIAPTVIVTACLLCGDNTLGERKSPPKQLAIYFGLSK